MVQDPDVHEVAGVLLSSIGVLRWRLRQLPSEGELSLPHRSVLSRLNRGGPAAPSVLARRERVSPQGMGAMLATLEGRGLVTRSPDPEDGRRVVVALTDMGRLALQNRRNARSEMLAKALSDGFTRSELQQLLTLAPLLERVAQNV